MNSLSYADDLVIMAPSAASLSKLVNICEDFSKEFQIDFNPTKCNLMIFF